MRLGVDGGRIDWKKSDMSDEEDCVSRPGQGYVLLCRTVKRCTKAAKILTNAMFISTTERNLGVWEV